MSRIARSTAWPTGSCYARATAFGAQIFLVSSMMLAMIAPFWGALVRMRGGSLIVPCSLSVFLLPWVAAVFVRRLRSVEPRTAYAIRVLWRSLGITAPVAVAALWIVAVGQTHSLMCVAVMLYVAAVAFVVGESRTDSGGPNLACQVTTCLSIVVTPGIILGMTQFGAAEFGAFAEWSALVPVLGVGATTVAWMFVRVDVD